MNEDVTRETLPFNTENTLCIRFKYLIPTFGQIISGSVRKGNMGSTPISPTSTLVPTKEVYKTCYFEKNIRDILIKKYSLNDKAEEEHKIVVHPEEENYFEEFLKSEPSVEQREIENLQEIVNSLKEGNSAEMWVEKGLMRMEIFT